MTVAVLPIPWLELPRAATGHAISADARRSSRDLRLDADLAPSVSVDGTYHESIAAVLHAYVDGSRPDWDGYGARPITAATCAQALAFLNLLPTLFPRAEVVPHPDGELAFEWSCDARRLLTVSINESGKLSYAALIGQTRQHGTEFLLDTFPESIALALRRVHSAV